MAQLIRFPLYGGYSAHDISCWVSYSGSIDLMYDYKDRGLGSNCGSGNFFRASCQNWYQLSGNLPEWFNRDEYYFTGFPYWHGKYCRHGDGYTAVMDFDENGRGDIIFDVIRDVSVTFTGDLFDIQYTKGQLRIANNGRLTWWSTKSQAATIFEEYVSDVACFLESTAFTYQQAASRGNLYNAEVVGEPPKVYHELNTFYLMDELQWYSGNFRAGCGQAKQNMLESLPEIEIGTLANVLEVAGSIASFANNHSISIPKTFTGTMKEGWLAYRYAYTTTKMDILEYNEVTQRILALAKLTRENITFRGKALFEGREYRCSASLPIENLLPKECRDFLQKFGGSLSAAAVWDMIPYTFMVDWFFHIGDFLTLCQQWRRGLTLPFTETWYSEAYTRDDGVHIFTRVKDDGIYPKYPLSTQHKTSSKTITMRCFDAVSIF